jgi:hypothetical protein
MYCLPRRVSPLAGHTAQGAILATIVIALSPALAVGQTSATAKPSTAGQVSFDFPNAPPATVEIDLHHGLIRDALGLGNAAVAGFLEGLMNSGEGDSSESAKFVAEQLTSARELGDIASAVVHEIHVRVYDGLPDDGQFVQKITLYYDKQLSEQGWESVVKVNDEVRVYVHREAEAVQGVFVIAADRNDLVLVNFTGDVSPQNVRQLTATATKIAVKLGLRKEIDKAVGMLRHEIDR